MHTLRFVIPYARPYAKRYLLGVLVVPFSIASALAIPWLTGEAVDLLARGSAAMEELPRYVGWILGLAFVRAATLFAMRWWIIGASRKVEFDLRNTIFRHLLRLDQSFYATARTGDLMSRITIDVERVRLLAGPIILYSASTLCMLLFAVPLMLSVDVVLTLLVMVPLSLLTLAVRRIGPKVHEENLRAQETLSDLSSLVQEDFAGIRTVKAFAQEEAEARRFDGVAANYLENNLRAARVSAWMHPVVAAVGDLALISLLLVGGILILERSIRLGDFVKFAGYQTLLMWPMISIGWVVNQYHRAAASVVRLRELLSVEPSVKEPQRPRLPPGGAIRGEVSVRGLTYSYGGGRPVLEDVNLEVPRGSTVAIVGRTGSGKSTLVHLIPRLLPVPQGTVFVDGVDVNELPLKELRRAIGFVPQESFLFSQTLNENIAFGVDEPSEDDILGVAEVSRFAKDIDQFPLGYRQMVGERGVTLSGGQKQRAALARALLVKPRILILDDAFSAVDTETEKEILLNLKRATEGMTAIIVSHRVSSILHADRIYVLDEGRVVEEGTHSELLRRDGLYAELYRLQLLSDELDRM